MLQPDMLTVDLFVNRSARFKTGQGCAESESGRVRKWVNKLAWSESWPARALDGFLATC